MIYFNEIEPFCIDWLRNQFGNVDERDILEITEPVDAIRQHYFAGLGGWEWALRLAGWPEDQEIWTGSCPCQPFSIAGKREADKDERDLWPAFFRLIALGRPAVIVGEQVNGAIAYGWLDRICDDLEGIGYAVASALLPACGVGAPHIRGRLYWTAVRMGDSDRARPQGREQGHREVRLEGSAWAASRPIRCSDGRWRRVPLEPGFFPLADGGRFGNPRVDGKLSSRIGALKGAGNAIVIPLAAEFIRAVMDVLSVPL